MTQANRPLLSEPRAPSSEPRTPNPQPKISIVTPSFNQGKYLEKTILSVLEQGYPNLEYIIIDGGSSDESVEIIRKYADRLTYWVSEPDRGQSHAINKGFEWATGEIFGWLNSDDWYHPGTLQAVADAFATNPDAGAVVGAGDMYSEEYNCTQTIEPFPVTVQSLYGAVDRFFAQPSCFFTSDAWKMCGPLDETLQLAMDLDLWLKIAKKYRYVVIDRNLSVSLVHQSAKTTALASQSFVDASLVIIRHGGKAEGRNRLVAFLQELCDARRTIDMLKEEKAYLMSKLSSEVSRLSSEVSRLSSEREHLEIVLNAERNQFTRVQYEIKRHIQVKDQKIADYEQSLSWRVTAPLRSLGKIFSVAAAPSTIPSTLVSDSIDLNQMATLVSEHRKSGCTVLVLDFNLGGGSNLYSRNMIAKLESLGHTVILLEYRYGLKDYHVEFNSGTEIAEHVFGEFNAEKFSSLTSQLTVDKILVNQLVTWPQTAKVLAAIMASAVPYQVFAHDYFLVCPNWTLFDYQEHYCGVPDDLEVCAVCLTRLRGLDVPLEQHTDNKRIEPWRSIAEGFLASAEKVICFSGASREIIKKAYPILENLRVQEHSIPEQQLFNWRQRHYCPDEMLTIAVTGGINVPKGSKIIGQLIDDKMIQALPVRFVIVGEIQPIPSPGFINRNRFVIHGGYSRPHLASILEDYNAAIVLIPSLCPETFCFSASEALLLGFPVLCCDIGAQADRVRKHDAGWVVDEPYLDGLVTVIQQIVTSPQIVQEKSLNCRGYQPVAMEDHFSAISDFLKQ